MSTALASNLLPAAMQAAKINEATDSVAILLIFILLLSPYGPANSTNADLAYARIALSIITTG
ncbi:hypothetical protein WI96_18175 [Burkholderia vietnamiensis]|nr:hypothetical protein WI96_18175 [Burkholderia vietnamiensis]